MSDLSVKVHTVLQKLKQEWKTFTLALVTTAVGAWQFAVDQGADWTNLLGWVDDKYRSALYFLIGMGFLFLRRYLPTAVETPAAPEAPVAPSAPEVPTSEPQATVKED